MFFYSKTNFSFITLVKLIYAATSLHYFILDYEQGNRDLFPEHTELKTKKEVSRYVFLVTESA
jgi:hypothetical protein